MQTTLIAGIEPLANDDEIMKRVAKAAKSRIGGKDMVIGLRNSQSKLYRRITVSGLQALLNTVETLQDLDMEDELEHSSKMKEGCDAIFSNAK